MEITISFNAKVRKFNPGESRTIRGGAVTWLVGKNGCGKSTFMQLLRNHRDDMKSVNSRRYDGMVSSTLTSLAGADVTIVGMDEYRHCLFLDSVVDYPLNFENAATAAGLIGGGGMAMTKLSRGQGSTMCLHRFMCDIAEVIKPADDNGRALIVMDEVDEGMDMDAQAMFGSSLVYLISDTFDADVICITHSILPILASREKTVFRFDTGEIVELGEFLKEATGRNIQVVE